MSLGTKDKPLSERLIPLKTVYYGTACAHCMKTDSDLAQCAACKRARYCGRTCQRANWPRHRAACQHLAKFRDLSSSAPRRADDAAGGRAELRTKLLAFETAVRGAAGGELPANWTLVRNFIAYSRVCAVCLRSEYELEGDGDARWTNCPSCRFGWCCSEEHWEEYRPRHDRDACARYVKSIATNTFRYNHAMEKNDTFFFVPNDVRNEPMESFPTSWEEYFNVRCPREYSFSTTGMLPSDFFPASTVELSQVATCLYGMFAHDISRFDKAESLTIHVVGADPVFEVPPTCVWEEIMHCLPVLVELKVDFVGPEACKAITDNPEVLKIPDLTVCPTCTPKDRKRMHSFYGKTYHDFNSSTDFCVPDFLVAFNTGMHEEHVESWETSLQVILDLNVPALFTSYNKAEADKDYDVLKNLGANILTNAPVLNPVPVMIEEIDVEGTDSFFQCNMYCICFKGRQ